MQNGVTALHRAAIDGHADVARALLDGGCSMDKKDEVIIVANSILEITKTITSTKNKNIKIWKIQISRSTAAL